MTLVTYPLDNTDYSMEDAALFHCTRTTGIYADNDFTFSVSGADNTIALGVGIAWMRMSRFKGVVAALKTETAVNLGLPDPVYPRIDHVVIQYDANKNVTEIVVKNGTAASNPQPPERSTSEALYEIHLAEVRREPGATAVTARNVTDLRLNENYCGIMAESVTKVDTAAINAQVTALIQALQAEIDAVKAGTAYLMKSGDTMTGDLNMGGHAYRRRLVGQRPLYPNRCRGGSNGRKSAVYHAGIFRGGGCGYCPAGSLCGRELCKAGGRNRHVCLP